jgi:mono/diheme cytochrome c family protein
MASRLEEPLPPGVPPVTYAPREPRLRRPPFVFIALGIIAMVASWVPLVLFARGRVRHSESPRVHMVQDMGTQPKYREQQTNDLFADGRSDRPHVPGTIARGTLQEDDHYFRGYKLDAPAGADGKPKVTFLEGFPKDLKVDQDLIDRGQRKFNIYCTACHGWDGSGNGPVAARAAEIGQTWAVANLTSAEVRARPEGHIFNTITNGIRSMPSYSSQISDVRDRWAIVAYVRALQVAQPPVAAPAPTKTAAAGAIVEPTDRPRETARAGAN